jgi:ABC-type nitrate/sulfonate/bicarbonate transport system substrate-binding protein
MKSRRRITGAAVGLLLTTLLGAACGGAASAPKTAAAPASSTPPAASAAAAKSGGSSASSTPSAGAAEPSLTVAYGATIGAEEPLWLGQAIHAYSKNGVKVHVQYIAPGTSYAALVSGQLDALEVSGPPVISADLHGADMVMVAGALNRMIMSLYSAPNITKASQLVGKVVATDRPGTPTNYGSHVQLSLLHLKASQVKLLPLGTVSIEYKALLAGQVQAANLVPPYSFDATKRGYHDLVDTFNIPYQNVGIVVLRSRLKQLTPALVRFLRGYQEAIVAYNQHPNLAMRILSQYSHQTNQTILKQTYTFYKNMPFNTSLQPTVKGMQNILDFLSSTIPAAKTAKPQQFLDTSLLAQMKSGA